MGEVFDLPCQRFADAHAGGPERSGGACGLSVLNAWAQGAGCRTTDPWTTTIVNVICAYLQMPYTPPGPVPVEPLDDAGRSFAADSTPAKQYEKHLQEHEKRTQAGVPQLRRGKGRRIPGLRCGNGPEPSDGSCH